MDMYHTCPTCSNIIITDKKYPTQICDECWYLTLNKNGNDISFGNVGINGGFLSFSDGKIGEEHQCFINGIECYAQEGGCGGIVIQSLNNRQLDINQ